MTATKQRCVAKRFTPAEDAIIREHWHLGPVLIAKRFLPERHKGAIAVRARAKLGLSPLRASAPIDPTRPPPSAELLVPPDVRRVQCVDCGVVALTTDHRPANWAMYMGAMYCQNCEPALSRRLQPRFASSADATKRRPKRQSMIRKGER